MASPHSQLKSLFSLTGQIHTEEFPYEEVLVFSIITPVGEIVVGALGKKGTRVVDVAVLPSFRKLGIASALIDISGVDTAYIVSKEAYDFWIHIGWHYFYDKIDKGTKVKVFVKERKKIE